MVGPSTRTRGPDLLWGKVGTGTARAGRRAGHYWTSEYPFPCASTTAWGSGVGTKRLGPRTGGGRFQVVTGVLHPRHDTGTFRLLLLSSHPPPQSV